MAFVLGKQSKKHYLPSNENFGFEKFRRCRCFFWAEATTPMIWSPFIKKLRSTKQIFEKTVLNPDSLKNNLSPIYVNRKLYALDLHLTQTTTLNFCSTQ